VDRPVAPVRHRRSDRDARLDGVRGGWYYEERTISNPPIVARSFPMDAALIFGLGPLYLVAGWLSSRSVSHHGSLVFLRSQPLRPGLPTVVFLGMIGPAAAYLGNRAEGSRSPADPTAVREPQSLEVNAAADLLGQPARFADRS
jgi:hypothetical protein